MPNTTTRLGTIMMALTTAAQTMSCAAQADARESHVPALSMEAVLSAGWLGCPARRVEVAGVERADLTRDVKTWSARCGKRVVHCSLAHLTYSFFLRCAPDGGLD